MKQNRYEYKSNNTIRVIAFTGNKPMYFINKSEATLG